MKNEPRTAPRSFNPAAWADDFEMLRSWAIRNRWVVLLVFGLAVRVLPFWFEREFWLDEESLLSNVKNSPVFQIQGVLHQEQVVPPGYLMLLRTIATYISPGLLTLRSPSLVAGTLAFFLFWKYCQKSRAMKASWLSCLLFTCNADAIYYCQEMKPYAFDLLVAVVALRACRVMSDQTGEVPNNFEMIFLALSPWFSISSIFTIGSLVFWLIVSNRKFEAHKKQICRADLLFVAIWVISFGVCYVVEKSQVSPMSQLWRFWDFAFLKWNDPLHNLALKLDNLINPFHFVANFGSLAFMLSWASACSAVFITGFICLMRNERQIVFYFLTVSGACVIASLLKLYPFHGRTMIALLPFGAILFAEGIVRLYRANRLGVLIALLLMINPVCSFLITTPYHDRRPIHFDGDLMEDYFIHKVSELRNSSEKS